MNQEKNNIYNAKTIGLAFIGIVFIVLYFVLVMHSPLAQMLKPQISKEEILSRAQSFFNQLITDPVEFKKDISTEIDLNLFRYVQFFRKKNHRIPDISIGSWKIVWRETQPSTVVNEETQLDNGFEITFDFSGNLMGFHIKKRSFLLEKSSDLSEDDAEMEAKFFLESFNIDTKSMVTTNRDIKKTNNSTTYNFTLKNKVNPYPHLTDTYIFEYVDNRIVSYQSKRIVDLKAIGQEGYKIETAISLILLGIIWLTLVGIIIVTFVRKLRKDELEFKRGLLMGIVSAVLVLIAMAVNSGVRLEIMIGGAFVGLLALLGLLILFPVAESCTREAWPEKLEVIDLLFQGKGGVRETGTAILHAFFLTGITVLLFGGFIFITSSLHIGYSEIKQDAINVFQTIPNALFFTIGNVISSVFIGFVFLGFWAGYLKKKISSKPFLFIFLLALTFNLGGLHRLYFYPPYLGLILVLPITLIWAHFVRIWDLFTVLLSLTGVLFFLGLMLLPLMPDTLFSLPGMAVIIFVGLSFLLGVYLVFRQQSVKDYESYVPEYVNRIAEKERFLKELEIARGVQMRFLPQRVPELPSLEIVSLCQPAMEVGGDYYDFIQMNERYMSVLIGDVSGKGVSAAFYMTMVKGIIKTLSKKVKAPAILLAEANDIFYENAPRDVFITIIYGIFDLKKQTLTIASAGHNPLIVCRHRTRKTEMINPRGIALGLVPGDRYRSIIAEKCIFVKEQDVIVFYTDGVSEAMNPNNEIFGEERLRVVIEQNVHLSPQQLQEKIIAAVKNFSGKAPQHDDFTMVVIKIRPKQ